MPRIMIISSLVAHGHVGLSAALPVCQALGVEITALPTTVLSNHPGWPHVAGAQVPPGQLTAMADAIAANGWLAGHDALLTGYLPGAAHVEAAAEIATRLRAARRGTRIVVDPVLGDTLKGLYIAEDAAAAIRDRLVPLADILTPNAFELAWLTGRPVAALAGAVAAARALAGHGAAVHLTSPPLGGTDTGVLTVERGTARLTRHALCRDVPHGAGDVFAALIAAGLPVGAALGHLSALAEASQGADHLDITGSRDRWLAAPALPAEPISDET